MFRLFCAIMIFAFFFFLSGKDALASDLEKAPPEILILPGVFSTPETGFGGGAGLFILDHPIESEQGSKANAMRIGAIYTEKKQFVLRGSLEKYVNDNRDLITVSVMAQKYPDAFFGVGGNTLVKDEEKYTSYAWEAQARFLREVTPRVYLGTQAVRSNERIDHLEPGAFLDRQTDQNGIPVTGTVPFDLAGLGLLARVDTRDDYQDPVRGYFIEGSTMVRRHEFGSTHQFNTSTIDGRWFVPLTTSTNPPRLAFQCLAISNNGSPPFQALAQLGGRDVLRGYFLGRYRDRDLLALQSELRIPLRGKWGAVGYAAVGNVARTWEGMRSAEFKPAGGIGARYRVSDVQKVNLRLDFTWGRETPNPSLYLSLAEAF